MREGLLSVIIVTYENSSLVLERAIRSVKEQKYQDYEIILVDANAKNSDYSKGLREDLEGRSDILLISCPSSRGELALAKNKGAEAATGEYIAYLWAEDAWNPEYTQRAIALFEEEQEAGLVFCRAWYSKEDAFSTEYCRPPLVTSESRRGLERDFILQKAAYSVSQVMFRSKIFQEMQGFDPYLREQEDYDLWLRISLKHSISGVNENLVCRYADTDSLNEGSKYTDVTGFLQLYSKHKKMYDRKPACKLILFKKIAACYKNSHCYRQWIKYILRIKRLEKRVGNN